MFLIIASIWLMLKSKNIKRNKKVQAWVWMLHCLLNILLWPWRIFINRKKTHVVLLRDLYEDFQFGWKLFNHIMKKNHFLIGDYRFKFSKEANRYKLQFIITWYVCTICVIYNQNQYLINQTSLLLFLCFKIISYHTNSIK